MEMFTKTKSIVHISIVLFDYDMNMNNVSLDVCSVKKTFLFVNDFMLEKVQKILQKL